MRRAEDEMSRDKLKGRLGQLRTKKLLLNLGGLSRKDTRTLASVESEISAVTQALNDIPAVSPDEITRKQAGKIYFVGYDGFVKIGFTIDVAKRMMGLRTGSPRPLSLYATIDGSMDDERELHVRFARYRLEGEWFELSDEIIAFIDSQKPRPCADDCEN
jgi:hypothetical protein